jgi:Mrp family chromosome partitioning ATPase
VLLAGLAGLLGVLALVLVLDLTRRLIATEEELAAAIPVPVLGTVRRRSRLAQTHVEVAGLLAADRRSVVVAGVQDEGSGARGALALAGALTAAGAHVVIIDAGAGRGSASLSWLVRLDDRPGLLEALAAPISGTRAADLEALTVADGPQLQVLPRGRRERAGRVDPRRAERLVRRLGRAADMVVVSGSPTSALSGAATWGGVSDGVVLAVRRHRTSRDAVREAAEALARADVDVLGTLLVVQTAFGARPRRRRRAARAPATAPATLTPATDRLRELQT